MYRLSCSINNRFEDLLEDKYREEGVQGELCRLLVQPPCRFYRLEKSVDGAPPRRIYQSHKPRVSLRCVIIIMNKEALNVSMRHSIYYMKVPI